MPPFSYARELKGDKDGFKCQILIEQNQESDPELDNIQTEVDGADYQSNQGYILGAPVLQSFALILDFQNNRVGFGEKVRGFGARVTTASGSDPIHDDGKELNKDNDEG